MNRSKLFVKNYTLLEGLQPEKRVNYFLTETEHHYGVSIVEEQEQEPPICVEYAAFTHEEKTACKFLLFLYENGIGAMQLEDVMSDALKK